MRTLVRRIRSFLLSQRPFWIGVVLSSSVGTVFYVSTAKTIEKDGWARFGNLVRTVHYTILSRVKSYSDVLRSSASLFQTSPDLTREQFHRYVQGLHLETEFPGIETINYAVLVKDADRSEFERRMALEMAATGGPERAPFKIKPPGRRSEYLVMSFIEPETAWASRLGVDLMAAASRNITPLLESRDTGGVGASGMPIPMLKAITGLGMRLAVYSPRMPAGTVAQRRAAYIGSVGIAFSVERLMGGVLEELPVSGMRMTLQALVDGNRPGEPKKPTPLYDSLTAPRPPTATMPPAADDEFNIALPIEFSQRNWEVQFRVKKSMMQTGLDAYVPWLALIAGFVSTALLYALFHALTSSRRHAMSLAEEMTKELRASETNLQVSNAKLRQLAAHAENIKEGERKRIAREIHDDLGQNLLALRIEADLLASRTGDRHPLLHERAQRTLHQIDSTIKSVRQIINDLRPNVLDLGLNAAVDWQITEFRRRTGIACKLVEHDHDIQISDRTATALFRILQESLTNISRHANANSVTVELWADDELISMLVSDNGQGLQPGGRHKPNSFGLVGIEERVKILGGRFTIRSGPASGTTISVSLPLHDAPPTPHRDLSPDTPSATETAFI